MYMNTQHPHFNLAMELLASVPRERAYVRLSDLVEQLGLGLQRDIGILVRTLAHRGFVLSVRNGEKGRVVTAKAGPFWQAAQDAAKAYLAEVYPGRSLIEHPMAGCVHEDHRSPQTRSFLTPRQRVRRNSSGSTDPRYGRDF